MTKYVGIIPARAGFTRTGVHDLFLSGDHPRSRGVYAVTRSATGVSGGSSPLARGLRVADRRCAAVHGIIPARAGFTADRWSAPG